MTQSELPQALLNSVFGDFPDNFQGNGYLVVIQKVYNGQRRYFISGITDQIKGGGIGIKEPPVETDDENEIDRLLKKSVVSLLRFF